MEEVFEIKQLANKGFGIVASKELQPGQLVLVEQAGVLGKVICSKYYKGNDLFFDKQILHF